MEETTQATTPTETVTTGTPKLRQTQTLLKYTYALVPIVAGLDKFANVLTNWAEYLSPAIASVLPVEPTTFMWLVGIIEIAAAIAVLTRWTREAAYVVAVWLLLIALNLLLAGQYDIVVRDVTMAVGAVALAWLTEVTTS